ncbi:SNF2 helicase associated domain-containing protein [Cohnella sp. GCM10012308]|uniref:SNF2 helicase associated domain-containing protein n=1 Tax=Cohnella sp. GCM10012308 TaxID=3317329 RepID=UPI00360C2CF2
MIYHPSLQQIKLLCGQTAYERGMKLDKAGKAMAADEQKDERRYDAYVWGAEGRRSVRIDLGDSGIVDARCDCSAAHSQYYCEHIAAALIHLHEERAPEPEERPFPAMPSVKREALIPTRDLLFTKGLISLFDGPSGSPEAIEDTGTEAGEIVPLDVEFICKAVTENTRSPLLAVEMKVGPKRLYVVPKLKEFLERIELGQSCVFAKHFVYDPAVHVFKPEDRAIVDKLIVVARSEAAYRDAFRAAPGGMALSMDRLLILPPLAWEDLLPLFARANVRFEYGMRTADTVTVTEEPLPLVFELDSAEDLEGYRLDIRGLEKLVILENYGCVLADGTLHRTGDATIRRLEELKRMFAYKPAKQALIAPAQMESFLDRVVPSLKRIGRVDIAQPIADRIVSPPLAALLDLDWLNGRLLARLTYRYGDKEINALQADSPLRRDAIENDAILVRDVDTEHRIMALIERASFKYNGSELYLEEEDLIYRFQYRLLPELERLVQVNATAPMRRLIQDLPPAPRMTIDYDAHASWLEVRFDVEGIDDDEIRDILRNLVEKKPYYRLSGGGLLSLEDASYAEISRLMDEMGIRKSEIKGARLDLAAVRGLPLMDADVRGGSVRLTRALRELLDNMRNPDNLDFPIPDSLTATLRDYQKFGYQWMRTLAHYRFGGVLADDMGLGKTLQGIAFIASVVEEIRATGRPALIVSPASLIFNWKHELSRFAPGLRVRMAAGDKQERLGTLTGMEDADVVITSYPLLRRDMELYGELKFYCLFLDEAQAIKNHATQTAQAVGRIQAGIRFALTGTPIENSLDELWSLYDAVFPDLFGSRREFASLSRELVAKRVRPFLLRRMKRDVLKELPDKIETLQHSELTDDQKKLYVAYLSRLQTETLQQLEHDGFQKSRMRILAGLTRLRQLCCHPSLFVEGYEGSSGKLDQLLEIVGDALDAGKRILLFSQFTSMLAIIREELSLRSLPCFYLDGQTPAAERVELCRRFNEGENDIFLISLRAGGTGLNLTGADTVILYDLWWNPAVEQQAADRAHRIGQKNVVQVIKLVAEGTIEEKMVELQQRKRDLIAEVIQPGEESLSAMTEDEIRELLNI